MDNFRRPKRQMHAKPKAVDGIMGAPSASKRAHNISSTAGFAPSTSESPKQVSRQLDDFTRADGYHPIVRPLMQSDDTTSKNAPSSSEPSLINKTLSSHQPLTQTAEQKKGHKRSKWSWKRGRKWLLRTTLALLLIVIIVGGFLFAKGYLKLHKIFGGGTTAAALEANVDPSLLKGEGSGRVNILLLGIGGAGHDGPDLTDTMLVASIDPVNNKASLLSIPRDLWVNVPSYGHMKINAVYETGKYKYLGHQSASSANHQAVQAGFNLADQTVEQVLGISIQYHALIDFQAFQQAVDAVGGVSVNVPTTLYDPTIAWENNHNPVIAKAGTQTFNGQHALLYVRSRETSSDFARTQRQRAVLIALKQRVLSLGTFSNPFALSQLISAFGDNVVTDLSINNAMRLYTIGKQMNNNGIQSIGLADPPNNYVTTANMNGLSVVRPTAGFYNYTAIQNFVRSQLIDGYIAKENAQITVLNGTAIPGLANKEATILKTYGYNLGTISEAPTQSYQKTVIVDLSKGADKYTKHYLEQRFGVSAVTKSPDSSIQTGNAKFVIILGQDDANPTQ